MIQHSHNCEHISRSFPLLRLALSGLTDTNRCFVLQSSTDKSVHRTVEHRKCPLVERSTDKRDQAGRSSVNPETTHAYELGHHWSPEEYASTIDCTTNEVHGRIRVEQPVVSHNSLLSLRLKRHSVTKHERDSSKNPRTGYTSCWLRDDNGFRWTVDGWIFRRPGM